MSCNWLTQFVLFVGFSLSFLLQDAGAATGGAAHQPQQQQLNEDPAELPTSSAAAMTEAAAAASNSSSSNAADATAAPAPTTAAAAGGQQQQPMPAIDVAASNGSWLLPALSHSFVSLDREFGVISEGSYVGSTAVVVLIGSSRVWVAHAGDSRAVLGRGGGVQVLTSDHKASRDDEVARVQVGGGFVFVGVGVGAGFAGGWWCVLCLCFVRVGGRVGGWCVLWAWVGGVFLWVWVSRLCVWCRWVGRCGLLSCCCVVCFRAAVWSVVVGVEGVWKARVRWYVEGVCGPVSALGALCRAYHQLTHARQHSPAPANSPHPSSRTGLLPPLPPPLLPRTLLFT